jgi:hypothetical protein
MISRRAQKLHPTHGIMPRIDKRDGVRQELDQP